MTTLTAEQLEASEDEVTRLLAEVIDLAYAMSAGERQVARQTFGVAAMRHALDKSDEHLPTGQILGRLGQIVAAIDEAQAKGI